ncbi:MAG: hypothetical protein HKN22_08615, partial [Bacteroidia bacterium]|nr:hypothetical protein [Bacteroidia bacterium]
MRALCLLAKATSVLCLLLISLFVNAQIQWISPFTGNQGGAVPLFGECINNGASNMYIDWEVYGPNTQNFGGQQSQCRVIIRGMDADADPQSLIASDVICIVNGIFLGEVGNNDDYFANLNLCNLPDGRYSIEIQCDDLGGDYDNSTGGNTARATWIYNTPTPYYSGTSG